MSKRVGICEDCGHVRPIGLSHTGAVGPCSECGGVVDLVMKHADGSIPSLPKGFHHHREPRRRKDPSAVLGLAIGLVLILMATGLYLMG